MAIQMDAVLNIAELHANVDLYTDQTLALDVIEKRFTSPMTSQEAWEIISDPKFRESVPAGIENKRDYLADKAEKSHLDLYQVEVQLMEMAELEREIEALSALVECIEIMSQKPDPKENWRITWERDSSTLERFSKLINDALLPKIVRLRRRHTFLQRKIEIARTQLEKQ